MGSPGKALEPSVIGMGRLASLSVHVVGGGGGKWGVVVQRWVSLESSCVPLKEDLGTSIWDSGQCGFGRKRMVKQASSKSTVPLECQ